MSYVTKKYKSYISFHHAYMKYRHRVISWYTDDHYYVLVITR